jgi:hypothetical protein
VVPEESKADDVLNSRLNRAVERLLKINREKGKVKQPSGEGAVRPEWSNFV